MVLYQLIAKYVYIETVNTFPVSVSLKICLEGRWHGYEYVRPTRQLSMHYAIYCSIWSI